MRPMDHMDYDYEFEYGDAKVNIKTYSQNLKNFNNYLIKESTCIDEIDYGTYNELLSDLKWILELEKKQTKKLTKTQQESLLDWLKSFNGMPIVFEAPYGRDELPTCTKGICNTFAILSEDLIDGMGSELYPNSFEANDDSPKPKPKPKPIEVVIPPPPENLDEALKFLKGLT